MAVTSERESRGRLRLNPLPSFEVVHWMRLRVRSESSCVTCFLAKGCGGRGEKREQVWPDVRRRRLARNQDASFSVKFCYMRSERQDMLALPSMRESVACACYRLVYQTCACERSGVSVTRVCGARGCVCAPPPAACPLKDLRPRPQAGEPSAPLDSVAPPPEGSQEHLFG